MSCIQSLGDGRQKRVGGKDHLILFEYFLLGRLKKEENWISDPHCFAILEAGASHLRYSKCPSPNYKELR